MAQLQVRLCKNCVENKRQKEFYLKKSRSLERKLENNYREVAIIEKLLEEVQQTVALMKKKLSLHENRETQENNVIQPESTTLEGWQHVVLEIEPEEEPQDRFNFQDSLNEVQILEQHLEPESVPNVTSTNDLNPLGHVGAQNGPLVREEPENGDRNGPCDRTETREEENFAKKRSFYQKCRWDIHSEEGTPKMCGRVYTVAKLVQHILLEHGDPVTPACHWRDCEHYGVPLMDTAELEDHVHCHMFNENYRCATKGCGRLFSCQRDLEEHGAFHVRDSIAHKVTYPCPHEGCRKVFKKPGVVESHLKTHRLHPCKDPGCTKVYKTRPKMNAHYRIQHLGIREFQCTYEKCGVRFTDRSHLDRHVRLLHLNEKPYRCDHPGCEEAFAYPSTYQTHRKTHEALVTDNDTGH